MKSGRKSGTITNIIDIVNIVIGIFIVICAVFLFVDLKANEKLFTVVFFLATVMNMDMAFKYYKRADVPRTIALVVFALLLLALSVVSLLTLWV